MNIRRLSLSLGLFISLALATDAAATQLVVNGDFSDGNVGFTSDYAYSYPMAYSPGRYSVGTKATNRTTYGDHTTGDGNFMTVDGASRQDPLRRVWEQVISVTPNTDYLFEAWARGIWGPIAANLAFRANGSEMGTLQLVNNPNDYWQSFSSMWNSGSNESVTLTIVDLQTDNSRPGNDFALDDISFTGVPVPIPATAWLLGSALVGVVGLRRVRKS